MVLLDCMLRMLGWREWRPLLLLLLLLFGADLPSSEPSSLSGGVTSADEC